MRKSMLAAIIAASALVPAAAFAQDDHHDRGQRQHNGGNGGGEQHAQRQAEPRAQAQPAQQPRFVRPQVQQQVQVQGQGNFRRADRSGNGGGFDRGRGQQQPVALPQAQVQADAARQQQGRRGDARGNGGHDWRGGGDPRATGGDARPQNFEASDRRGNNWNGGNWRENDRRGPGAGTQVNRGRGGNWNRDWRQDRRYDWNRYRTENRSLFRLPRYYAPSGWGYGYRRFSIGLRLSSILFSENYWIDDPYYYDLPPAYGPYRWVRYYNDALLVDVETGEVVDTVYDIFW